MLHQGDKVVHRPHGAATVAAVFQPDSAPGTAETVSLTWWPLTRG
jgi:hypothetical protein